MVKHKNRIIQIKAGIVGPVSPQVQSVHPTKISDYPSVSRPILQVAQNFTSPLLLGPPLCDELVALVQHMFTEEEATLVQHIKTPLGKTARTLAAAVHRPVEQISPVLERLAFEKYVLLCRGKRYGLLPLVPGVFEAVLIQTSWDALTDWHRRFAILFEALYNTGYFLDYFDSPTPILQFLPVRQSLSALPFVLPADRQEAILDRYKYFAVGLCQCRMTEKIVGRGCDRPLENCVAFGNTSQFMVRQGKMKQVSKRDILTIKAEAEAAGLVSWVSELGVGKKGGGISCSCCGCCCHGMRVISEFNTPGIFAPPHFRPQVDEKKCIYCARCAKACPVGAITVDIKNKSYQYQARRCIGCGLCTTACKQHALEMKANPHYQPPPQGLWPMVMRLAPGFLRNAWAVGRGSR